MPEFDKEESPRDTVHSDALHTACVLVGVSEVCRDVFFLFPKLLISVAIPSLNDTEQGEGLVPKTWATYYRSRAFESTSLARL